MLMLSNAGTKKERFWVNDDGRRRRRRRRRREILSSRAAPPLAAGSQKSEKFASKIIRYDENPFQKQVDCTQNF